MPERVRPNLSFQRFGSRGPLLVLLHWLSGSSSSWHSVASILATRGVQCLALDLPGFGESSGVAGFDVRAMTDAVIATIAMLRRGMTDQPWMIAGHSMGGKLALVVARAAVDGKDGLENLRGVFLVSPSPPSPEPMEESKREQMLEQLGEAAGDIEDNRKRARKFIEDNTGKLGLSGALVDQTIATFLQMNRTAFRAWLQSGSKEDWSSEVGKLPLPSMILAGSEESALGPAIQRDKTLPHVAYGCVVELRGCGHLAPLERPFEVAEYACEFFSQELGVDMEAEAAELAPTFSALLESSRVAPQTRAVLDMRLASNRDWNHHPSVIPAELFRTMRALAECVVPRAGFDVAGSIERQLTSGKGDGWRFATLPADSDAWRRGLASLDAAADRKFGVPFVALHSDQQNALLREASAGELGKGLLGTAHLGASADVFSAAEMKQWFEEVRGEFAKCYMAHPATMERVGFTGFADDAGFTQIQIGEREEFER